MIIKNRILWLNGLLLIALSSNLFAGGSERGAALPQRPLFWEHLGSRAVYQDGWKLVADGVSKPWELFNLADDPTEQNDLSEKLSERADALKLRWETWAEKNNVLPLRGTKAK